jgi:hypothetical protein
LIEKEIIVHNAKLYVTNEVKNNAPKHNPEFIKRVLEDRLVRKFSTTEYEYDKKGNVKREYCTSLRFENDDPNIEGIQIIENISETYHTDHLIVYTSSERVEDFYGPAGGAHIQNSGLLIITRFDVIDHEFAHSLGFMHEEMSADTEHGGKFPISVSEIKLLESVLKPSESFKFEDFFKAIEADDFKKLEAQDRAEYNARSVRDL